MDNATHRFQTSMPHSRYDSEPRRAKVLVDPHRTSKHHQPSGQSGPNFPIRFSPCHLHGDPWHELSVSRSRAPKLVPLISKFEALDAASLGFSVSDARPPQPCLSRSRAWPGSWETGDMKRMKATRERLLSLFERPGWGARTLRGLKGAEDVDTLGGLDDMVHWNGRAHTRTDRHKDVEGGNQITKQRGILYEDAWFRNEKGRGDRHKRRSRIKDRIRFFNGGVDIHPSHFDQVWNRDGAQGQVASYSSRKYPLAASSTKLSRHPAYLQKQDVMTQLPTRPTGNQRNTETASSPWMTAGFRSGEINVPLPNDADAGQIRGRARENFRHIPFSQTNTKDGASPGQAPGISEGMKHKISERAGVLYTTGSRERKEETSLRLNSKYGRLRSDLSPVTQHVLGGSNVKRKEANGNESEMKTYVIEKHPGKPVKIGYAVGQKQESKIQDRIRLFSNGGMNVKDAAPPTKPEKKCDFSRALLSHTPSCTQIETQTQTQTQQSGEVITLPSFKSNAYASPLVPTQDTPSTTATQAKIKFKPVPKPTTPQPQNPEVHSPSLVKSSRINDKISHFQSLASAKPARVMSINVKDTRRLPPPKAKRVGTWPLLTSEKPGSREDVETMPQLAKKGQLEPDIEKRIEETMLNEGEDKGIEKNQGKEKNTQKLRSRQERSTRHSRSRSRSALSVICSAIQKEKKEKRKKKEEQDQVTQETGVDAEMIFGIPLGLEPLPHRREHDHSGGETVHEIWVEDNQDQPGNEKDVVVVDTVVAQCELTQPRPMRLTETLRMMRLCRGYWEREEREEQEEQERGREKSRGGRWGRRLVRKGRGSERFVLWH